MMYTTNPQKQRRYDRTDYHLEPYWAEQRSRRTRRTVLAVLIPAMLDLLAFLWSRQQDPAFLWEWILIAVLLPMVYDDNEQLLRDLAEASATEVERYPGTTGELPPDKLMQNPPDV